MKRFLIMIMMTLMVLVSSCGVSRYSYTSQRTITENNDVVTVLETCYPQLLYYYNEGVLRINSVKEILLADGNYDYRVKYDFVRYYYREYSERMEALKVHFPELYQMYVNGIIVINTMYKYVEKDTGKVRHHISYRRINDYYYGSGYYPGVYGGVHLYYRPRPMPVVPRPNLIPNPGPQIHNPSPPNNPGMNNQNIQPNNGGNARPGGMNSNPNRGGTSARGGAPTRSNNGGNSNRGNSRSGGNGGRR